MKDLEFIVELKEFPDYFISTKGRIFSEKVGNERRELKPSYDKDGYSIVSLHKEGKCYTKKIHRLVCETFLEKVEGKNEVDHINRSKTDNRLENLKWCDRRENCMNKGMFSHNTSGTKGVCWDKIHNRWLARFYTGKNTIKATTFKKKEDAIKWRKEMEKKYYEESSGEESGEEKYYN